MKALYLSFLFSAIAGGGLMYFSHAEVDVKYSQEFGGKVITLTETMTYAEMLALKNKRGFVQYE